MRKVKITLRPTSHGKKLYLFPTSEALYVWLCSMEQGEQSVIPELNEILLEPGDFIEAELRGFEYSYEDNQRHKRLDLIRLGLAQKSKNSAGLSVTVHTGWVSGGLLPMRRYVDNDIEVVPIDDAEARLDLPSLFKDNEAED
jgi:hypothetical protein